jgi:hypothetical protein
MSRFPTTEAPIQRTVRGVRRHLYDRLVRFATAWLASPDRRQTASAGPVRRPVELTREHAAEV